ncbi:electron transfer flavoprotein subunit alpha/FixB family protein [Polluticaenibacter yanchengensis]|uniref:Electron transfer flavoprotein subunit alpha/FixB family protein n=1 Tax=Polluticaenibacter yanchengensis TaxID=3014562 RepID=A0ABT4UHT7_9BACT|nr:electron transfer flavoprotein subunit alpha/FixB family protein [Chitinophagaceae bacterium LY-5]
MSVLIYLDQADGQIKKSGLEAASYGAKVAEQLGTTAVGLVLGTISAEAIKAAGKYGINKVLQVTDASLDAFDAQVYTTVIAEVATQQNANVIIFSHNANGKAVAPRLSVRLKAGLVAGAVALPDTSNGFIVKKSVFSGKAFANVAVNTAVKIVSLNPNAYGLKASGSGDVAVENISVTVPAAKVKVTGKSTAAPGEVPLSEASLVVSGGRGLKGPENWGIVTDLAHALGAATACSRPVADAHWRPHNEHVGQTGGAISPNLYIAIGISGAIQHLAGVNRSKYIVVINKDPEAPFFKAADYGIVGDAFEIVPKITEAVKKLKA